MNNGENWHGETYAAVEETIGYRFHDRNLLIACFTHSSYRNNVDKSAEDNERLEFLGDAVLQLAVSDMLYRENRANEGRLTDLRRQYVSRDALTPAAERLSLMQFLRRSGEEENLGAKAASSLFEAVVAGIYLDGGMDAVKEFLGRTLTFTEIKDYKSRLQELVQERAKVTPTYETKQDGDEFVSRVCALGAEAFGRGESKKSAETKAARELWKLLSKR